MHKAEHLRPEVAVICRASSLPGITERLTGEPSADKVNWLKVVFSDIVNISVSLNVRPMFGEHLLTEGIALHLPSALHSGPLQAEIEAAYPGKERAEGQHQLVSQVSRRSR